jgi:chemotaxis protein methyltransferase CheR
MTTAITPEEMPVWTRYIKEICGIHLDDSKAYLVETRLGSLLSEAGASNFSELFYKARADASCKLRGKVIEAITTNETSFFRDTTPFELLRHKLIPDLIDRRNGSGARTPIRIWSAACSTGQEAYSTAIVLKELLGDLTRYDIRILGTDISNKVVAQASYGEYSRLELERGLPPETLARHFNASGDQWRVHDEIRALANFRTMNLLEPFSFPHPFDIIFCRNVAIYFTEADKIRLFRNLTRYLARDGCLIIGSTESISGLCPELESKRYLRAVYYQWKGQA